MAYFEVVPAGPGLNRPPSNPCRLLDFGYLVLADGERYEAETGDREVLAVLLGGTGAFAAGGRDLGRIGGRPNVFSGKPHSVYIPCGAHLAITAHGRLEAALVSAPSDLRIEPYVIPPERVTSGT